MTVTMHDAVLLHVATARAAQYVTSDDKCQAARHIFLLRVSFAVSS